MTTGFTDSYGNEIKMTDKVKFTDESGKTVESQIYPTLLGLAVKRKLGSYSTLKSIIETFHIEVIRRNK